MNLSDLHAEFPRDAISWRCQTLSKEGTKGLALAYIDARDVMRRLDEVCGPENWSDRYEVHGSKTICYLSIRVTDDWVTKADGAGDTDVEAEKGSISDAFKRAAVKWGIGRYLYDIPAPWVPCESYEAGGKKRWSKWSADPWAHVRGRPQPASAPKTVITSGKREQEPEDEARVRYTALSWEKIHTEDDPAELAQWWNGQKQARHDFGLSEETVSEMRATITRRLAELKGQARAAA